MFNMFFFLVLDICLLLTPDCVSVYKYFTENHQELQTISIKFIIVKQRCRNMKGCTELTDGGIKDILRVSGSKLWVLDVSGTGITGIGILDGAISLPMLEKLSMKDCHHLTDGGIKDILRVFGSKFWVLDVSGTGITGIGFQDQVNSLPMLEELKMKGCTELTYGGIKDFLRVSGSRCIWYWNNKSCNNISP